MLTLGHPILGDPLYAHDSALHAADRLHLHAAGLTIRHPTGGRPCHFVSPCPF
jgi:tRNA pseudouridine32 synthase/23S rRNA pseudouridine746 synthase